MNNKLQKYDAYEVSDPTDWLETPLRSLSAVDAALRCQVCKDFYTTPMITSCSHTFCSLCIRRCLNNDGKCPACRTTDQELKLRFNGAMEDLVEGFKKARPEVFAFATKPAEEKTPKRRREKSQTIEGDEEPIRKRTRSTRQTRSTQEVIVDTDEDDADFIPEDGYVQCPICSKVVKEASINSHIDRGCPEEPPKFKVSKKPSILPVKGKAPEKRPERLAQLHYGTMKDTVLRKKLAEHSLVTWGTRQEMQRRFTEWVTLWNANCDATHPKSKAELRGELDVWERTQGAHAQHSSLNTGAQIRSKEFDRDAWSNQNDDSFKQLIADARKKAQEAKKLLESRTKSPLVSPLVSSIPETSSDSSIPSNPMQNSEPHNSATGPVEEYHKVQDSLPSREQQYPYQEQLRLSAMMRDHERSLERGRVERKNSSPVKEGSQTHDPNEPIHNSVLQRSGERSDLYKQCVREAAQGTSSTQEYEERLRRDREYTLSQMTPMYPGPYGPPDSDIQPSGLQHGIPGDISTNTYGDFNPNFQDPSSQNGVSNGTGGHSGIAPGPSTSQEYPSPSKFSYGSGNGAPYYEKPEWS